MKSVQLYIKFSTVMRLELLMYRYAAADILSTHMSHRTTTVKELRLLKTHRLHSLYPLKLQIMQARFVVSRCLS